MKKILIIVFLFASTCVFSQDKLGFGNDPEGADSAGMGTLTTWVKQVTFCDANFDTTTVKIGSQRWLKYNVRLDDCQGGIYAYNNDENNVTVYGRLYSYLAAQRIVSKISGFHIPTFAEFTALKNYLNTNSLGARMKEAGTMHWSSPNTGATNSTGFTALPGGYRACSGFTCYYHLHEYAVFLTDSKFFKFYYDSGTYGTENYGPYQTTQEASLRLIKD